MTISEQPTELLPTPARAHATPDTTWLDNLGVAVYATDARGRIIRYNEAAAELWGRRPELGIDEWCGSWKLYWPDGKPMRHDECPMALTLRLGEPVRGKEAIAERPDGSRVWFIPYPTPLFDDNGALTGAVNVLVDITDRKRANADLVDRREHLEAVFRSPVAGIIEVRDDGTLTMANDRFCEIAGRSREELLAGMSSFDLTFDEDRARMHACLESLRAGEESFSLDTRYVRPDGSIVWVHSGVSAIRDAAGGLIGAVAIVLDITDRRRTDDRLKAALAAAQEERRAAATIGAVASELTSELDLDTVVQSVTDAAARLTGARFSAFFHRTHLNDGDGYDVWASSGVTPESLERTGASGEVFARVLAGGSVIHVPDLLQDRAEEDAGGSSPDALRIRSYLASPVVSASGEALGALFCAHTEPNVFDEHAESVMRGIARWASIAIDNAKLYQRLTETAEHLAQANHAKDEFLGLVSHELRTPLTAIRGNAEVLLRSFDLVDPESRAGALGDISAESERLQRIIDNLLLLARLEQGQELEREPLLLVRVVEQVIERHRRRNPQRSFEIVERQRPRPVSFAVGYLEQVVENLVSNAEKYSPPAEAITIEIERTDTEVRIRILDRGVGLVEADADHLFDPFYRSAEARYRAAGLGIGLAVCKRLVEAQAGRIWAKPREGGGAEFGFSLPILAEAE